MLDKAASFHKNLISDREGFDTGRLEAENHRLSIELAIARERERVAQQRATELARANAALKQTVDALATKSDLDCFLAQTLKVISETLDAPVAEYWYHSETGTKAHLGLSYHNGKIFTATELVEDIRVRGIRIPTEMTGQATLLSRQRHFVVDDLPTDPIQQAVFSPLDFDLEAWCTEYGVRRLINIPLVLAEKAIGALALYFPRDRRVSEQQIELGYALAQQAILAIQLTRLAEEAKQAAIVREQKKVAQERAAHLARANAALQKTIDALGNINRIEDFIPLVLKIVLENFQAVSCAFFEHADEDLIYLRYWLIEGQVLTPSEILALDPDKYSLIIRLAGGFTAPDKYLGTHHRHRIHSTSLDHAAGTCIPEFDDFCCSCGWETELNVPCVIGEVAEGALVIYRGASLPYSECEIALAETLSAQLALALQASRLAEEAKQAAIVREREQVAQQRATELERANEVLRHTASQLVERQDLIHFLNSLLLEVAQEVGAVNNSIFLYDRQSCGCRMYHSIQDGQIINIETDPRFELWRTTIPATNENWQLIQSRGYIWAVLDTDAIHGELCDFSVLWHRDMQHRAVMCVLLQVGDEPLGYMGLCFRQAVQPSPDQISFIQALAHQAALAIQMTQLAEEAKLAAIVREQEKAAQERAAMLEQVNFVLQRSTERLSTATDPKALIVEILRTAGEVLAPLGVKGMGLIRYQPETKTVRVKVHIIDGVEQSIAGSDLDGDWSIDHPTLAIPWRRIQSEDFIWGLTSDTSVLIAEVRQYHESLGSRSIAYIPLRRGEETTGWIGFNLASEIPPTAQQIEMIQALTRQVSLAAEMERLAEIAREGAIAREQQQMALERAAELATINQQLQQHTREVQRSYSILEATAQATNALLTIPDFDQAVNATLQILGEALETDRVKILEWVSDSFLHPASGYYTISYEWVRVGTIPQLAHPSSSRINIHGAETFIENLIQNDGFGGLLHEWPQVFWEPFAAVQAQGIYCVPIRVERQLWGVLVYDDCQTSRERKCSELTVLKIAADCIGSAIQRQRTQQALLQSEQARSGELAKANHALRRAIARLTTADSLQLFLTAVLKEAFQTSSGVNGAAVFDYEPASHTVQLLGLVISGEVIDIGSDPRAEVYRSPIPSEAAGDWHIPDPERRIVLIDVDDPVLMHTPEAVLWHKQQGHQLLNVIPLFSGEQPLGFLGLAFTTRTPPSDAQIEHWWALAQHVGLALRLANLAEEAKQTAILDERNRMARDIHDTLAQSFTGIIMQLEALKSLPPLASDETQAHFSRIRDIARLGLSEARRSVQALRPVALETASFSDALRHLLNQMTQGTPVQTTLHIEGVAQSLPASVEENLLRIAQEAVTNAIRHGQAQTIALQLLFEPTAVHLQIRDDGQGFAPATHLTSGFGLIGMQERVHHLGGHLHLVSQLGQGTEITVTIPSQG
jgi:signal transduction histidine kinase